MPYAGGDVPTGLWSTYDVGFAAGSANREDLADIVTIISPSEAPFFMGAPKTQARLRTHEWMVDALTTVTTGGAAEGSDFKGDTLETRTRLSNQTQIYRKDIVVSDTQQEVDPAGIRNEYEYQVMKGMKELSRNCEASFFKTGAVAAITGTEATGAIATIKPFKGFTCTTYAMAATGVFASADLLNLHQKMFSNGAVPDSLWMSPGVKSDFVAAIHANGNANTRNIAASDQKFIGNIEVFIGPFGVLPVIVDRFIPQTAVTAAASAGSYFLIEKSKARIAMLRPFKHVPLAKNGDSTRGFIRGELTLELLHPSCIGYVTGVTANGVEFGV